MKKTTLLAAFIISIATPAMAQQWKHLGNNTDSTSFFYNPKTASVSNGTVVSAWTKKEFNVDADTIAKGKLDSNMIEGTRSVIAYEEFDCSNKKKRTITGMSFEKGTNTDLGKTNWLEVVHGSIDENLLDALCQESKISGKAVGIDIK